MNKQTNMEKSAAKKTTSWSALHTTTKCEHNLPISMVHLAGQIEVTTHYQSSFISLRVHSSDESCSANNRELGRSLYSVEKGRVKVDPLPSLPFRPQHPPVSTLQRMVLCCSQVLILVHSMSFTCSHETQISMHQFLPLLLSPYSYTLLYLATIMLPLAVYLYHLSCQAHACRDCVIIRLYCKCQRPGATWSRVIHVINGSTCSVLG